MLKQGGLFNKVFWFEKIKCAVILLLILSLCAEFFYWPKSVFLLREILATNGAHLGYVNIAGAESLPGVVINEVAWMGSQNSASSSAYLAEWIELRNTTDSNIDLTGWTIKAGSWTKAAELQNTIPAQDYYLIERKNYDATPDIPAGAYFTSSLNNDSETMELKDNFGALVDSVDGSDKWRIGGSNGTKATLERRLDGGWQTSAVAGGTPKAMNSEQGTVNSEQSSAQATTTPASPLPTSTDQTHPSPSYAEAPAGKQEGNSQPPSFDLSNEIFLSEILPNPKGSDAVGEFIELFNGSSRTVKLAGWKLAAGKKKYEFKEEEIRSNEYLVLSKSRTKLTLGNAIGEVGLWRPGETTVWQKARYEKAPEAQSLVRDDDGDWQWTQAATPGSSNRIVSPNRLPAVEFEFETPAHVGTPVVFDAADTEDEDGDNLSYAWEFGDGSRGEGESPSHAYTKPGDFKIKLTVSDGKGTTVKTKTIAVAAAPESTGNAALQLAASEVKNHKIIINEIMPNPEGSDTEEEWIELYNGGTARANLFKWQLDDEAGGSEPHSFEEVWLEPKGYYVIERGDSRLALNNSTDAVRLFDDLGQLVDEARYASAKEGVVFVRDAKGQWSWTTEATPGQANKSTAVRQVAGKASTAVKSVTKTKAKTTAATKQVAGVKISAGRLLRLQGIVTAAPGVLGTQVFYLESAGKGYQIYSYKKDFPTLTVGDMIEVVGETSLVNGETRLKTKTAADMRQLGEDAEVAVKELACDQVTDEHLGRLVKVRGELTKKTGTNMYLDDGSDELLVYLKPGSGIKKTDFKVGDELEVTGILSKTASGFRLLPRMIEDLAGLAEANAQSQDADAVASSSWALEPRDKSLEFLQHMLVVLVGLVLILVGLLVKMRARVHKNT